MGKQQNQQDSQNRQGQQSGRQQGQQDRQNDNQQGQQGRDPQRNKQSDSGQGGQQGNASGGGQQGQANVYGEGNYAASKQYNDATRDFANSGRVDEAAREAQPKSDADALQMQAAEAEGKRHSKGEDPALNRKSSGLSPDSARAPKPGEEE
jgi:hypothetical protein